TSLRGAKATKQSSSSRPQMADALHTTNIGGYGFLLSQERQAERVGRISGRVIRVLRRLRAQPNLLNRIKLIWAVQSRLKKHFRSRFTQIKTISLAIPSRMRGVSRSSRTLGTGCGGR